MAESKSTRQSRRRKFSRAFIKSVLSGEQPGRWTDSESPLKIKSTATGAQFFTDRKVNGRPVTITPKGADGRVLKDAARVWTLEEARTWARGVAADLARGVDPQPKPSAPSAPVTFGELAEEYLEGYAKGHTPKSVQTEGFGLSKATEVLGARPLSTLDATLARALADRYQSKPAVARLAWGAASRVTDLAVERALVTSNPFRGLKAPKPPRAKSRYPRLPELAQIDRAAESYGGIGGDIVRFALRLPLRAGTLASLTWGEVDLEARELRLRPGPGRKFSGEQRLPLPELAVELLQDRRPADPGPEALVFPGKDGGQFSGLSKTVDRIRSRCGVTDWSLHDFRRSMVSLVAECRPDISESALDRLLTHAQSSTQSGVKAVYQRASGMAGMRLAVDAWDAILRGALVGNVVQLRRGAA